MGGLIRRGAFVGLGPMTLWSIRRMEVYHVEIQWMGGYHIAEQTSDGGLSRHGAYVRMGADHVAEHTSDGILLRRGAYVGWRDELVDVLGTTAGENRCLAFQ